MACSQCSHDAFVIQHVGIHQQNIATARHRGCDRVNGQDATQLKSGVQHYFGPRLPAQTVKLRLDLLVRKAKRQDNFFHTGASQQLQVPLEQASASESQQALGQLRVLRLLHS